MANAGDAAQPAALASPGRRTGWKKRVDMLKVERKSMLSEVSGALGDLGTYIPIAAALALYNHLDLGTTLIFSGLFNITTGLLFGVPMPVQPMHTIAAAALSPTNPLTVNQIMTAGLCVSFMLVFLGLSGLMTFFNWFIPLSVVRGIQLAQGLKFAFTAIGYILHKQDFSKAPSGGKNRPWVGWDGRILAIFAFCFVIVVSGVGGEFGNKNACGAGGKTACASEVYDEEEADAIAIAKAKAKARVEPDAERERASGLRSKIVEKWKAINARFFPAVTDGNKRSGLLQLAVLPACLIIFLLGVVITFARYPGVGRSLSFGPSTPRITHPSRHDWWVGFIKGAIPQLPLSALNSVVAVVKLTHDLFPDNTGHVTVRHVATSVGMMNIIGCWFGAMPTCHGCGGLAGQYRFGARTGLSVLMLGAGKMLLGLLFGNSLIKVLHRYPVAILGVLLLYAGLELAMVARDMNTRADFFIVLVIASVALQWNNNAYGFLCGLAVAWIFKLRTLQLQRNSSGSLPPQSEQ